MSKLNKKIKKLVKQLVANKLAEYEARNKEVVDTTTGEVLSTPEPTIVPLRTEPTGVKAVHAYIAKYKGMYRRFDKTYTADKKDPAIKVYQGNPDRLMRKLAKEEGFPHQDFSYELVKQAS